MYRIFILLWLVSFLSLTFAESYSILQATDISATSVSLRWQPLERATTYKILYDQSDLLSPDMPEPLFSTESFSESVGVVTDLQSNQEYTFVVIWYDAVGLETGKTLPVHVKTFSYLGPLSMTQDPSILDSSTLELHFSHPIDATQSEVFFSLQNTSKTLVESFTHSPEDMRIFTLKLTQPLEQKRGYTFELRKIVALDGTELISADYPAENFILSGDENGKMVFLKSEEKFIEPLPIDTLPVTWPALPLLLLITLWLSFVARSHLIKKNES